MLLVSDLTPKLKVKCSSLHRATNCKISIGPDIYNSFLVAKQPISLPIRWNRFCFECFSSVEEEQEGGVDMTAESQNVFGRGTIILKVKDISLIS